MQGQSIQKQKKSFRGRFLKTVRFLLLIAAGVFLALFIGLNYFGERFIKRYLQFRVRTASHGVYEITFDRFRYNLITGNTVITKFQLIPDKTVYETQRKLGKEKQSLYAVTYDRMTLRDLSPGELFLTRTLHIREIELDKPVINFVAYPDSSEIEKGKFNRIYKDLYPVMSALFAELKIDSIIVNNGRVFANRNTKSGKSTEGDWLFSAILQDFDLNSYNYFDEEQVFYSKNVELRIHDFKSYLADSLYFLTADEVGFSLRDSRISGKGLTLTPNFTARKLAENQSGNLYQAYLPEFSIRGADLFEALLDKKITLGSLKVTNLVLRVFKHEKREKSSRRNPSSNIDPANLYTVISGKLTEIKLDTFLLKDASFYYFGSVTSPNPEVSIPRLTVQLHDFQLDSLAHLDTTKIFYARDIDLRITGFSLALHDKLHDLNAYRVNISTRKNEIEIYDATLVPSREYDPTIPYKRASFYHMLFPEVRIEHIDLCRLFNSKNLEFENLAILEPDLQITQYRNKTNQPDQMANQETFLEKFDLARTILLPYLKSIKAKNIGIRNGRISIHDTRDGRTNERISGLLDLSLSGIYLDSSTYQNRNTFIDNLGLEIMVKDFRYTSPDSLHRVSIGELFFNSGSSFLDVTDLLLHAAPHNLSDNSSASFLDTRIKSLQVNGFNFRKWFSGRTFSAQQIRLVKPYLILRSEKRRTGSSLNEPFSSFHEQVKKIEIGNLRIHQGSFDFAETSSHGKTSLLVSNFDFQLSRFLFDLTDWHDNRKRLQYDFLTLRLDPGFPVILNDRYAISFTRFLSESYPPGILVKDMRIEKPAQKPGKPDSSGKFGLSLPACRISGFDLEKTLFDRKVTIREIEIMDPVLNLEGHPGSVGPEGNGKRHSLVRPEISSPFHSISVSDLRLNNGTFHYFYPGSTNSGQIDLEKIRVTFREFYYDSLEMKEDQGPLFYCRDISIRTGGYQRLIKDSLYTLSVAGFSLSTAISELSVDTLALTPRYSDSLFSRKIGYQSDRFHLSVKQIELKNLDFAKLIEEKRMEAGSCLVENLVLDEYRDKRIPFPSWQRPPMPSRLIGKILLPVSIDSLWFYNAEITYREQTGSLPGTLFFDRMNLLIRNFTNDSVKIMCGTVLDLSGSTRLMGTGLLKGHFRFPLNSPADTFFFTGSAGPLPLECLNPMISNLTPIRIKSGVADSVNVNFLTGNSSYSTGTLDFYYHDLKVQTQNEHTGFMSLLENELYQTLLNLVIPADNNGYNRRHRTGYIWFRRDPEKGFMNFFWKSVFSGLKSSEGINSREQRALRKKK